MVNNFLSLLSIITTWPSPANTRFSFPIRNKINSVKYNSQYKNIDMLFILLWIIRFVDYLTITSNVLHLLFQLYIVHFYQISIFFYNIQNKPPVIKYNLLHRRFSYICLSYFGSFSYPFLYYAALAGDYF